MHITFVKKILSSGELCKKCREVSERLQAEGLLDSINYIAIADERDAQSEGVRLAKQYGVARAPFFLVEQDAETIVFDIYFKFKKFMLKHGVGTASASSL
ncbi:MAG: hypothetical protein ACJAQ6_000165 [Arenicella sp.]|jgi:hypothetical protein